MRHSVLVPEYFLWLLHLRYSQQSGYRKIRGKTLDSFNHDHLGVLSLAVSVWFATRVNFLFLRFFLGVAEAGFFPGMIYYLTFWFPLKVLCDCRGSFHGGDSTSRDNRQRCFGRALSLHGAMGISGWMWLFVVTGVPAVLLGIVVLFLLLMNRTRLSGFQKVKPRCPNDRC
ncbi:MAG: hypothetical protein R3D26_16170 [Cyanobacteriota/Melainabacteria group bacterium]